MKSGQQWMGFAIAALIAWTTLVLPEPDLAQTPSASPVKAVEPDPMDATVASPPPFRQRLDDHAYAIQSAAILKSFAPVPDAAYAGARVARVDDGSPAADLGLVPGDVICSLDDERVISDAGLDKARHIEIPQAAKVWSQKDSAYRVIQIPAGKIGIGSGDFWSIENEYLHGIDKGTAPNPDLLVAARAARTDGALAETALFHANLHTPTANLIAAAVAYYDLRLDDCLSYANAALPELPAEDQPFARVLAYRSALATFHWAAAENIGFGDSLAFNKKEFVNPRLLPAAIKILSSLPAEPNQDLSDLVTQPPFEDHSKDIANSAPQEGNTFGSDSGAAELRDTGKIAFAIPDGHFNIFRFGPPGANIDLRVRYQYRPTNEKFGRFDKNLKIQLITERASREVMTLVLFQSDGTAEMFGRGLPVYRLNTGQFCGNGQPFNIHITAVGGRCQITLNDHRLFYGPLHLPEANRGLCFSTMAVGLTGQMDQVSWKTAGARANH